MDPAWGRIWADHSGRGSRRRRFTEPLVPGFRRPAVLGEEPVGLPEDHWWVEGLAHASPMGSTGSRENAADIRCRFGLTTPGQKAVPAWSAHELQNATTGHE